MGTSTYADDITREIPGISAENVITGINRSNDALNTALAPDYVQNSSRQEILPHFAGRGSHAWDHTLLLTDVWRAKHHEECRLLETHTLCSSGSSRRPHRCDGAVLFFRAMLICVALSGLVAFAPSSTETNEMDKCLLALARKALRGEATCIDGHTRTRSSKWIWKQLKLVPTDVALAVQRLLWWQQIVGDPSSAWSFLFAFFWLRPWFARCCGQ